MRFLLKVSSGIDWVTTWIGKVAWWMTLLMVLIGLVNVVTRYVGRSLGVSLGGTQYTVLQTYAYDFVFLMGAAYVLRSDAHVRVDIIYTNLSGRARAIIDIVGTLLFLLPFSVMGIWFAQRYVAISWQQREINLNAGGLPVYPVKTLIIIAFGLLIVQAVSELIKNVAFLAGVPGSRSIHEPITKRVEAL